MNCIMITVNLDRAVGIATSYEVDDRGVGVPSPGGVKNFPFSIPFGLALRSTQPPIQLVPGVKRPASEADH
jgi:hypothetical protein